MNAIVSLAVVTVLFLGVRLQGAAVRYGWVPAGASRKSAHMLLGIGLLASWTLYDGTPGARWFAALPVLVLMVYFSALGLGLIEDASTVRQASRSGDPREMLGGPVLYCLAVSALTLVLWRSPASVAALACLTFGDGVGEVVGGRVSSPSLPWNRQKSVAGSLAVLAAGWAGSVAAFAALHAVGFISLPPFAAAVPLLAVAGVGALAESATPGALDNVAVVATCALSGWLLL